MNFKKFLNLVLQIFLSIFSNYFIFNNNRAYAVSITGLIVPLSVANGSNSGVILDCLYSLHPKEHSMDSGLVVKWFFNRSLHPVYQWIYGKKPQDAGILRGRLKLDYRASNNSDTMYRALNIIKPTVELSGEYKCLVSTYHDEDFMIKNMIVYVPERRMDFIHIRQEINRINVSCRVEGIYPIPKLYLYKDADRGNKSPIESTITSVYRSKEKVYDLLVSATFLENELETPTAFDCELHIPGTSYTRLKTILYFPGATESLSSVSDSCIQKYVSRKIILTMIIIIVFSV